MRIACKIHVSCALYYVQLVGGFNVVIFSMYTPDMNELSEEEHEESGYEGTHGNKDEDGVACQLSVHSEVQNGELDSSLPTPGSVSVGNDKDLQIFLHGLPKNCAEKDIIEVFSQFGEIESIKTIRKKNGGIAFVRYMSTEAAKKALAEFKEGAEVLTQ